LATPENIGQMSEFAASSFKLGVLREMAPSKLTAQALMTAFFDCRVSAVQGYVGGEIAKCLNSFAVSCVGAPGNVAIGAISSPSVR
jgi:hypothetical protein